MNAVRSLQAIDFAATNTTTAGPTRSDLNALRWWIKNTIDGAQRCSDRGVLPPAFLEQLRAELDRIERDTARQVRAARTFLPT